MEIFFRIDPDIYGDEIVNFGENPPDEFMSGGDTFNPDSYTWDSGVHRISKDQYEKRGQLDEVSGEGKLWFFERDGLYFAVGGTERHAKDALKRHFKTRFNRSYKFT